MFFSNSEPGPNFFSISLPMASIFLANSEPSPNFFSISLPMASIFFTNSEFSPNFSSISLANFSAQASIFFSKSGPRAFSICLVDLG